MSYARSLAIVVAVAAIVAGGATTASADDDGPIVGTPPLERAVPAWIETYAHPDYWSGYLTEALLHAHINLPYPFDPVKPEVFLPNVPVANGPYVSALPVEHRDLADLTYEWRGERKTVEQFMRTTRTDAVVLVVDGTVIGEWYAGGYSPDVRHQPWSVTKTFVAAAVGIAHAEGLVSSVHDPIEAYIPELAGTAWEGATIEQLLHMESGVHWDEDTPVLVVNTQVEQWLELALDVHTDGAIGSTRNEFLAALPASYDAGTEFRYNSGNTQVLAWLLEVLYDAPFNEILAEQLWQPMGAAGDAVMIADRVGGVVASQGLYARPHDFARFGELLRNGGRTPEGHQVVPRSWVEAMLAMSDVSGGRYGYQTWAEPGAGPDAYSASGFQGQKVTVVPGACVTAVRLSHALGGQMRDGDATDLDAYGFAVEFFSDEWAALVRQAAEEIGACPDDIPAPAEEAEAGPLPSPAPPLPATGAGAATLGAALAGLATGLRRVSRTPSPASSPSSPTPSSRSPSSRRPS